MSAKVWIDEDDDAPVEASSRLQPQQQVEWVQSAIVAKKRTFDEDGEAEENVLNLATTAPLVESGAHILQQGLLRYTKLDDFNKDVDTPVGIFSHRWNSNGSILAAVGPDRTLQVYSVLGTKSTLSARVELDIPAYTLRFISSGEKVILTGRQSGFAVVDLATETVKSVTKPGFQERDISVFDAEDRGNLAAFASMVCGVVHISDTRTLRCVNNVRVNETPCAVEFGRVGSFQHNLWVCAGDQVSVWDLRNEKTCLTSHKDTSGVRATSFASSERYHAVGSDAGIVTIYPNTWEGNSTIPALSTAKNLRTAITSLAFNVDARLLLFSSDAEKNAMRMFHVPSGTTYSNFPRAFNKSLGRTLSVGFSPSGGMVSIGNNQGRLLAYRLAAYEL